MPHRVSADIHAGPRQFPYLLNSQHQVVWQFFAGQTGQFVHYALTTLRLEILYAQENGIDRPPTLDETPELHHSESEVREIKMVTLDLPYSFDDCV
jgi:hypothetical protein